MSEELEAQLRQIGTVSYADIPPPPPPPLPPTTTTNDVQDFNDEIPPPPPPPPLQEDEIPPPPPIPPLDQSTIEETVNKAPMDDIPIDDIPTGLPKSKEPDEYLPSDRSHRQSRKRVESQPNPRKMKRVELYNSGEALLLCSFYYKVGACRHYDRCTKRHIDVPVSNTIKLANLYSNPLASFNYEETYENSLKNSDDFKNINESNHVETNNGSIKETSEIIGSESTPEIVSKTSQSIKKPYRNQLTEEEVQELFDQFYKDIFTHISKIGEIRDLVVCENLNDHLNGNVYVEFERTQDASEANIQLNSEWYNGKPVYSALSPVSDFEEAYCHEYNSGNCAHGMICNYMHLRFPSPNVEEEMYKSQKKTYLTKRLTRLKEELPNAAAVRNSLINDDDDSTIQNTTRQLNSGTRALLQQLY